MLAESCIEHPKNEPLIIVRTWQLIATEGDRAAAALLSFFEYWHNIKLKAREQAQQYNDTAELHGERRTQLESLVQWHTTEQLEKGILLFKESAIAKGIKKLVTLGFIEVTKNPNPRFAFDKTRHFLFKPDAVNRFLKTKYPFREKKESSLETPPQSSESASRPSESTSQSLEFTEYPKTTTEITNFDSIQNSGRSDAAFLEFGVRKSEVGIEIEDLSSSDVESNEIENQISPIENFSQSALIPNSEFRTPNSIEPLTPDETDLLRAAHQCAYNVARPWRKNPSEFKPEVLQAVFEANPQWYSLPNGAPNFKKISDRLTKLERSLRCGGRDAIAAYQELRMYAATSTPQFKEVAAGSAYQMRIEAMKEKILKNSAFIFGKGD